MTREETIRKVLDTVLWTGNASDDNKRILTNALIKALEQEPKFCPNCGAKMLLADQNCDYCKYQNEVDGSNCYECVKGIRDNYKAESEVSNETYS